MHLLSTNAKEQSITYRDYPRCARCHMPVEKFTAYDVCNGLSFISECHGKTEVTNIPDEVLSEMLGSSMNIGTAFSEDADDEQ